MFRDVFMYLSLSFVLASLFYILYTRYAGFGTPLKDSLTPEQIVIKKRSARKRRKVFLVSFSVSILIVCLVMWK